MITNKIIKEIYNLHKSPHNADHNAVNGFVASLKENHQIEYIRDQLYFKDLPEDSPFHSIPIDRINGIEYFEKVIALVMPYCILFFSRDSNEINIHIKLPEETLKSKFFAKIKGAFKK